VKTFSSPDFARDFARIKDEPCQVTEAGKVVGIWTPAHNQPGESDFLKRVKEDFTEPLPFTGAELLKSGKKR
jgi:hypothetical protein